MEKVIERLVKFRDDRNWKQFHTPNNLAKSMAGWWVKPPNITCDILAN